MTTTVQTAPAAPDAAPRPTDTPGISLGRLVRVELRKAVDTRSGIGLLAAILLIDLVAVAILTFADATSEFGFEGYLAILMNVQFLLLPIVGVIAAAGEWSQRTTLQTFALEPRRSRVIAAKVAAALALMVLITIGTVVLAAAGHAVSQATGNTTEGWGIDPQIALGMLLMLTLVTLMGVAFGLLLHAPAIAIVTFLFLPQVFSVLPLLLPNLEGFFSWIDFQWAWSALFEDGGPTAGEWARIASTTAIWVVAPMVAGWYRTVRREAA
ncbi:hypothetical protein [Georgenia sp. Z1491]|uniref:hypothetical protein n=1 Tax=Georgenia sp. Z1491 TaxID=3416707 RepID=UPI003CF27801